MNINEVGMLKKTFDDYKHIDEYGNEYWYAHDLCKLLGYSQYQRFIPAIDRARQYLINTGKNPDDWFIRSDEPITSGKGGIQYVDGYKLSKLAAYAISMNADPSKIEVAFAQEYFLQSTAKVEILEKRMLNKRAINARDALTLENKSLTRTFLTHDVNTNELGIAMDAKDKGMFDMDYKRFKRICRYS